MFTNLISSQNVQNAEITNYVIVCIFNVVPSHKPQINRWDT